MITAAASPDAVKSIAYLNSNYIHVVSTILWSLLCFIIGIYIGLQYGARVSTAGKEEKPRDKRIVSVKTIKSKVTIAEQEQPSLHSIVNGMALFCRASEEKFGPCAAEATSSLLSVLKSSAWQHVYSNTYSHFWVGGSAVDGNAIMLKGEAASKRSVHAIVSWMVGQDLMTGMEGLSKRSDVQARYITDHHLVIARRVLCRSGSGSIRSSRRELDLVTFITQRDDDSYAIATCSHSYPEELFSTSPESASEGVTGRIKGTVHVSGFLLRPSIINGQAVGTEISFGCHFDMKGAGTVRGNTANVSSILSSVFTTLNSIQNGESDEVLPTAVTSIGTNIDEYSSSTKSIADSPLLTIEVTNDDDAFNAIPDDADSDQPCPSPSPSKKTSSLLGTILKHFPESPRGASSKLAFKRRNHVVSDELYDRLALDFDVIFRELSSISRKKEAQSLNSPTVRERSRSTKESSIVAAVEADSLPVPRVTNESLKLDSELSSPTCLDIYRDVWLTYGTYFDESTAKDSLNISWQMKVNKDNIKVYSSTVKNSTWCAIKAVTVMRAKPNDLLEVLVDANQMGDYDSMFKTFQVVSLPKWRRSVPSHVSFVHDVPSHVSVPQLCISCNSCDDILLVCEADRRTDSGAAALLQGGVAHRPQRFHRMRIMEEEG